AVQERRKIRIECICHSACSSHISDATRGRFSLHNLIPHIADCLGSAWGLESRKQAVNKYSKELCSEIERAESKARAEKRAVIEKSGCAGHTNKPLSLQL